MNWTPKKTVVVPVDLSQPSIDAVQTAFGLVDDASHVYIIHVLPVLSPTEPGVIWDVVSDETRCQHAEEHLRAKLNDPEHLGIHVTARVGDPGHQIAEYAESLSADLIVLPSHGRTGLKRLLIGSVAERVVRLAHCPVLVLRK